MFRHSTRQLAQCARLSLRAPARQSIARSARLPFASTTHSLRLYSSQPPPQKPDEAGDKKIPKAKGPIRENRKGSDKANDAPAGKENAKEKEYPIPPGFEPVTETEIQQIKSILDAAPQSQKESGLRLLVLLKKTGIPVELKALLKKQRTEGLSIMDGLKIPRMVIKVAEEMAKAEKALNIDFDSNKPGEKRSNNTDPTKPEQKTRQEGQQKGQQEDQQEGQEQGQRQQGQQGQQGKEGPKNIGNDIMGWAVTALVAYPLYAFLMPGEVSRDITWEELRKNFLDKGLIEKLIVDGMRVKVELNREAVRAMYPETQAEKYTYYFSIGSVDAFERKLEEAQKELGIPSAERIPVSYASAGAWSSMFFAFGPTLFFVGLLVLMSRRSGGGVGGGASGMFGFGKSRAKMFNHDSAVKVKFADVAGMDEAKVEIMEFVSFLKTPERFQRLGAKIPRGAILSGPPGTGKTLLAKATAGESQVPFFSVSGSEFVEMFVGVGASRVRDLFATARKSAPCIIFIDEIDAIGKSRGDGGFRGGGNDEREATLNQILTEMDGFNTSEQVVVLAGTNRPDTLDKALMRPGRFDRHIHIDRPTMAGRKDIFKVHLGKIRTDEDLEYLTGRLAALTPGFAGADIANAVNEAALVAARANAQTVKMMHFEQAIERVIGGLERKSLVLSPEEKRTVAYHEAGHAICGWFFKWADPLLKVSIIPRGSGALGYAQYLPAGDAYLMNTNQLMDRMAMTLGGRVSEELHFPTVTSGASDDFNKVTRMATTMVTQWGMSEKVGPLHFANDPNQLHKPFAESTAQLIDSEVRRIVDQAYKQCKDLLTERKKEVGIVAEELLRKEMLSRDDLIRLLGPREWPDKEEFSKYFNGTREPPFGTENTDTPEEGTATPAPAFGGEEPAKPEVSKHEPPKEV